MRQLRATVLLLLISTGACSDSNGPLATPAAPTATPAATPTVSSVTVNGSAPGVGATASFTATANLSNGTSQNVTSQASWTSSNAAVAIVTSAGLVTGLNVGDADITATYQGAIGTAHVTVVRTTVSIGGLITDATSGGVLPNVSVHAVDAANATKSTQTDAGGNYSLGGIAAGPVTVTAAATGYQTMTKSVTVSSDARVDLVLSREAPVYTGTWTGAYEIRDCQDIDPSADFIHLGLCAALRRQQQIYEFTLVQNGATVTGTYRLVSPMFSCPCAGDYGTFDMSGTVGSDGALLIDARGSIRGSGVSAAMTFDVRQATASKLVGTVSGKLDFGGYVRAAFSGVVN